MKRDLKFLLFLLACLAAGFLIGCCTGCADTTASSNVVKADVQNAGSVIPLQGTRSMAQGAAPGVVPLGDWRTAAQANFYGGGAR
jgi:hypothetical protein